MWSCRSFGGVSHIFVTSWGEFTSTLEDFSIISCLPLFGKWNIMGITLGDDRNLQLLTSTLWISSKSTYTLVYSICYQGWRRQMGIAVDVILSYWLSGFIISCDPEVDIDSFIFPIVTRSAKGKRLALWSIHLGPLYTRMESVSTTYSTP